ncbi:arginase family protein [Yersinia vastinensis]|uniref:arginase family protein n=1 Tax=Yersinia vastinensis TaxID=2890318 RepID=UPI0005E5B9BB|nr:arginase family protein [Yersinia vastinensis]OVZ99097.1 arginase [Yersinia frederiksenii]CNI32681.1 Arginase [Yersinia frederiksenii]CNI95569.1 Arginase [Yersinia frederiksenii]CNK24273.1 Arginase [Yersinia frederiksenii]
MTSKTLRLLFPQWQGGNNPPYHLGSLLLSYLSPESDGPVESVPVDEPTTQPQAEVDGITAKPQIIRQLKDAATLIEKHNPDSIVVFGGDCLVSLAPFTHLLNKYGDKLGVLWIDSHPDVQTTKQYPNAHAHVLGALIGTGDKDLVAHVTTRLNPSKIMIAGIHDPLAYEADYLARHNIATIGPEQVKNGAKEVMEWIDRESLEYLAIHLDLDVLEPSLFRSVLFAKPGRGVHDFGDVAEGQLTIEDVLNLIAQTTSKTEPVGLTIAEHLPWDMLNLKNMLSALPLMK